MSPETASRMMKIVGVASIGFALMIASAAYPPINAPAVLLYDIIDWPVDGGVNVFTEEARLLSAISGGVFAGLSMMLILIVAPAIRRDDDDIRRAAIVSILTWFVIDSAGSVAAGVAPNVVFNAVYLALVLAPLMLVRRAAAAANIGAQ